MTKIKICGITNKEDAFWASSLGADFVGINFCKDSLRKVSIKTAKEIVSSLPKYTKVVGIFVNEKLSSIVNLVKKFNMEYIQLHGEETKEYCKELRSLLPQVKIIKVIKIPSGDLSYLPNNGEDEEILKSLIDIIAEFLSFVDYILFDTKVDTELGGTGKTFNHKIIVEVKKYFENKNIKLQFFVAGGLNSENVASVIKMLEPFGVDVSSGVERLPRRKDFEKMKNFIRSVKES